MKEIRIKLNENSHPHAEMISAYIEDTTLSVFTKMENEWREVVNPVWGKDSEYFLCLPKHKDAVLNILNGGESEVSSFNAEWEECNCNIPNEWFRSWWYMKDIYESRIKPKKVKKLIAVDKNTWKINMVPTPKQDCIGRGLFDAENIEFIEIEVEV